MVSGSGGTDTLLFISYPEFGDGRTGRFNNTLILFDGMQFTNRMTGMVAVTDLDPTGPVPLGVLKINIVSCRRIAVAGI